MFSVPTSGISDAPAGWKAVFPPAQWLPAYEARWLRADLVAGVTLAAYAIPVSLAYAALAGLPPQVGIYGYLLGGVGYALFGSSRHLAIGPTSAIYVDLAGARMLQSLSDELAKRNTVLRVTDARAAVRDLLRAEGVDEKVGGVNRFASVADVVEEFRQC